VAYQMPSAKDLIRKAIFLAGWTKNSLIINLVILLLVLLLNIF